MKVTVVVSPAFRESSASSSVMAMVGLTGISTISNPVSSMLKLALPAPSSLAAMTREAGIVPPRLEKLLQRFAMSKLPSDGAVFR